MAQSLHVGPTGRQLFTLACCLAVAASTAGAVHAQQPSPNPVYSLPWVELNGFGGNGSAQGGVRGMLTLSQSPGSLLFLGFDGAAFQQSFSDFAQAYDVFDAGGYIGYRQRQGAWIVGGWAGSDVQQSLYGTLFGRAIAGVEAYSANYIFRASGFVPFAQTSTVASSDVARQFSNQSIDITQVTDDETFLNTITTTTTNVTTLLDTSRFVERLPAGFEVEMGLRIPVAVFGGSEREEFRAFVGLYEFVGLGTGGNLLGGRLRFELDLFPFQQLASNARLTLETEFAYDDIRNDQYRGGLRIAFPFYRDYGPAGQAAAVDLFLPIHRNTDVLTGLERHFNSSSSTQTFVTTNTETLSLLQ